MQPAPPLDCTLVARLLGAWELSAHGETIGRAGRQGVRRLLFYLLLRRDRARDRDAIAFAIWPDRTEERARRSLAEALSRLQSELLPPEPAGVPWVLGTRHEPLQWNPSASAWLDVAAFEAGCKAGLAAQDLREAAAMLTAAVALYRGPLLEGLEIDWVVPERERLARLALDALSRLSDAQARLGDVTAAIGAAERARALDPFLEPTYRRLMTLHARGGDRGAALRIFESCKDMLAEAFGVDPSPETSALLASIVGGGLSGGDETSTHAPGEHSPKAVFPDMAPPPDNLPAILSRFFGREREIASILLSLEQGRLLTILGTGGAGKTRLAIEIGRQARPQFADGVLWVPLADAADPRLVPGFIARAAGVELEAEDAPLAAVTERLRGRRVLLVLDNCEHVRAAAAAFIAPILHACPGVHVVATSREPLGIEGEQRWPIRPLMVPKVVRSTSAVSDLVAESESLQLFFDRVERIRPEARPTPDDVRAATDICRRVEGLPLAIELAAARANVLSVSEIAERLAQDFRVLRGDGLGVAHRHATLEASIGWSYRLLSSAERRVLHRLSVLARSFNLAAAEAICTDGAYVASGDVVEIIGRLVDRSMLTTMDGADGRRRFHMLEPIREYAAAGLAPEERDAVAMRLARHFYGVALEAETELDKDGGRAVALERLEADYGNFHAAMAWLADHGDLEGAMRMAGGLWRLWYTRGYLPHEREVIGDLVRAHVGDATEGLACAHRALGAIEYRMGDMAAATESLARAEAVFEAIGDVRGQAAMLNNLSVVQMAGLDLEAARITGERSIQLAERSGDTPSAIRARTNVGHLLLRLGQPRASLARYLESLSSSGQDASGTRDALNARYGVVQAYVALGELAEAERQLRIGFAEGDALNDESTRGQWRTMAGLLFTIQGRWDDAAEMLREAADAFRHGEQAFNLGRVFHNLGEAALAAGQHSVARAYLLKSLELKERHNDAWGIVYSQLALASLAHETGDAEGARSLAAQGVEAAMRTREPGLAAWARSVRARVELSAGNVAGAASEVALVLAYAHASGERRRLAIALELAAGIAHATGADPEARVIIAAADAERADMGARRTVGEAEEVAALVAALVGADEAAKDREPSAARTADGGDGGSDGCPDVVAEGIEVAARIVGALANQAARAAPETRSRQGRVGST